MSTPGPHTPAFRRSPGSTETSNPWMISLWLATGGAAFVGVFMVGSNSDPTAFGYNPTAAAVGYTLLGVAGVLLAGLLVAGAVCWQLRRS